MKCRRAAQIHDYNSNIIYTQHKPHKANTKTHTHTYTSTYRYCLTDHVNEDVQLMYTMPDKYKV